MKRTQSIIALLLALLLLNSPWVVARDVSQAAGNLILTPNHGGGEAWGKQNCSSCHALQRLHETVPDIKVLVDKKKFVTCTGCHGANGTKAERFCLVCHNGKDMPLSPLRSGKHRHDFNLLKDFKTTSRQCVACHDASDMDGRFEVKQDVTLFKDAIVGNTPYDNGNDFCLRCHNRTHQQKKYPIVNAGKRDQSVAAEDDYRRIDAHGIRDGFGDGLYAGLRPGGYQYQSVVDCVDCHAMHGTANPGLIIDDSRKGAFLLEKSFRNTPFQVEVTDGDYSQLCVLCHNMSSVIDGGATDTGNGLSGVHFNFGTDCVSCHSHGEAVQKGL